MESKHQILIVDDAEINRSMLADMLADRYEIWEAANGAEAIALLSKQQESLSLVLLDIIMPEMNGFEVLSVMGQNKWLSRLPVIMISAETSSAYIDRAYDLGATDYISRPFDEKTIQRRVQNTIMLYAKQKKLENMVTEQILEKERNNQLMVEILSNIVEFRNGESGLHVLHIRTITELLLQHLVRMTDAYPLTPEEISMIGNASSLHDIGKISIPEEVLNKPGRLTVKEFEVMKTHSAIGAQILENAPYWQNEELVRVAHDICRWHHERYDGNGYPDGLKGEQIPISAQVVAMADVYDALTNERIYKPAYTHEAAMQMILDGRCGAFNPLLCRCLVEIGPQIEQELAKDAGARRAVVYSDHQSAAARMLEGKKASARTLALLEQERIKYQFFASMSEEIQFEYRRETDQLTFSDWGAEQLGLDAVIDHPKGNQALHRVLSSRDLYDLYEKIKAAGPADPIVHANYELNVHGQKRWYKAVARPLWVEEEAPVLTGAIGKFSNIHEEKLQLEEFKKRAEQDSLTKLHNHMSARAMIEAALLQDDTGQGALILFDLDLFKNANDTRGHMFGDEVLKCVARRIRKNVRRGDIAARIGGDEFLIFTLCQNAQPVVKRLFETISGAYKGFDITLSMGAALCPQDGTTYDALFSRADQALYAAKKSGRQQYCFYDGSIDGPLSVLSPVKSDQEPAAPQAKDKP